MKASLNYLKSILLVFLLLISAAIPSRVLSKNHDITNQYKGLFLDFRHMDGMGGVFCSVLGALHLYDQGNIAGLKVNLDQGIYVDSGIGPNWWEYFFEPIDLGNKQAPSYKCTVEEGVQLTLLGFKLPRERGFALIKKYIHLKSHIQAEVDEFVRQHFKSFTVIGVHHRGTDKALQWSLVSYEKTYQAIQQAINQQAKKLFYLSRKNKKIKIYVATDDQQFLTYLQPLFPSQLIYNNFVRSTDGTPLHYGAVEHYTGNYQKGKEALIDSLLLSHCHILIRPTSSALSLVSTFFNPDSHVISLKPD